MPGGLYRYPARVPGSPVSSRAWRAVVGGCAALVAALFAGAPGAAAESVLRVGAASSLREAADAIARDFEASHPGVDVAISYGASSVLAAQLRAGAPLDLLLSADAELVARLRADGIVATPRDFAGNRLVVVARDAVPAFSRAEDLAGPTVRRVAIPHAVVPAGRYARQWLAEKGLLDPLAPRLVATEHARATLIAVDAGHVDAAIVYATDAALARRAHVVWEIPSEEQPAIRYAAAVSASAREVALAEAFLDTLIAGRGRVHLAEAGFTTDPSP
jgi:molybdate transport system substrate-binding protein